MKSVGCPFRSKMLVFAFQFTFSVHRNNPKYKDRSNVILEDIPFVQTILAEK